MDVLLSERWDVTVLHRASSDLSKLNGCDVRFKEVDLHDEHSVLAALEPGIDAVFHVAGNTSHWSHDASIQWKDNVLATRNLVNAALKHKVGRFIFTSTGATNPHQWMDERLAQSIRVGYVRTKRLSELEVSRGIEHGLDAVIIKPIIVIGRYDYHTYTNFFKMMVGKGQRIVLPGNIVFCHAEDVARAHVLAFERGKSGESYVLPGAYSSWLKLCQHIATLAGQPIPRKATSLRFLILLAHTMELFSKFSRRAPLMTPEVLRLLHDSADVTYYEKQKTIEGLGYDAGPLEDAVLDCYQWMKAEKMF